MPHQPVVPTAQLAPGVCFLSGDNNGPFIDTGKSIRGTGRVYLSLKALGPFMREAGWVPEDEISELLADVEEQQEAVEAHLDDAGKYREIVQALEPLLPKPDPVVREVGVFMDDKVRAENEALRARIAEHSLADDEDEADPTATPPADTSEGSAPQPGGTATSTDDGPAAVVEVAGQEVDIDALLGHSVDDIVTVAESWEPEARLAVLEREEYLRSHDGKPPRKTLVAALTAEVDA